MPTPSAVRRYSPAVQATIAAEIVRTRQDARAAGRRQLEEELDADLARVDAGRDRTVEEVAAAILLFGSGPGLGAARTARRADSRRSQVEVATLDETIAFVSAAGLTAAWGAAVLSTIAAGGDVRKVAGVLTPNVERTAATEAAGGFNDERSRILVDLGGGDDDGGIGTGDGTEARKFPGLYKVWSAFLDGKTCSRCFAADGEVVEVHKPFKAGAIPLHPRCRCLVEHVIVPKPERLEDIAIDYELFKEELRDLIREGRVDGDRHALDFVSNSLGKSRSPKTLTKRFERLSRGR